MGLRVISDRQRHLRWYCLHFSHWRGRRLSWGVGRRDLTQRVGENLILCPRWIKTSKYIIHRVKRPWRIVCIFMRRLLRDVSFPFQNEQVHSADPHFAKATPWPWAPFYVFLKRISHQICSNAMCRGSSWTVIIYIVAVRHCDGGRSHHKYSSHKSIVLFCVIVT